MQWSRAAATVMGQSISLLIRAASLFSRDNSLFCGKNSLFDFVGNLIASH
jgi:hypothetical protein